MKSKKKLLSKNKGSSLSRVCSEPEISKTKHRSSIKEASSTTERVTSEELRNDLRHSMLLNLQIPVSPRPSLKPRKASQPQRVHKSPKARPSHEIYGQIEDKTSDVTKVNREKNRLLAKVTALQQEICAVKSENKKLRNSMSSARKVEKLLIKAYSENRGLKGEKQNGRPNWSGLEQGMEEFKSVFCQFLQQKE